MSLALANLRNQVRTEAGEPSVTDLTDRTLDDKIRHALRRTLRRLRYASPQTDATKLLAFSTEAGVQSYALADLPDGAEIVEVHYGPALPYAGAVMYPGGSIHVDDRATTDAYTPGAQAYRRADRIIDTIAARRAEEEYRHDYLDGKLWLDPVPTGVVTVHVVYREAPRSDETSVPDEAERAVVLFAASDVLRYLANRYRGVTTPVRGATSQLFDRTASFEESARLLEEQAERECAEILAD
jgi:hypothetical protein